MKESRAASTDVLGYVTLLLGFALFLPGLIVLTAIVSATFSGMANVLGSPTNIVVRATLALAAMAAGAFVFQKGAERISHARKKGVVDGWTLLTLDSRSPVLYLRSFLDDEKTDEEKTRRLTRASGQAGGIGGAMIGLTASLLGGAAGAHKTQEQELVENLSQFGPCVAIGDPSETLPDLGAARIYAGDEWQLKVADLMKRAQLIVFRIGSQSPGFWWEVERVRQSAPAERVVFWIPSRAEQGEEPAAVYQRFVERFQRYVTHDLPTWRSPARLLRFGPNWNSSYLARSMDDRPNVSATWPKERPRRPIEKIFWKVATAAVLVLVAVRSFNAVRHVLWPAPPPLVVGSEQFMAQVGAETNRSLPRQIDSETELTNVTTAAGRLTYNYRLTNALASQVRPGAIADNKQTIAGAACADRGARGLLDHGVTLRYSYKDKQGTAIAAVDVTSSDCFFTGLKR